MNLMCIQSIEMDSSEAIPGLQYIYIYASLERVRADIDGSNDLIGL